MTCLVGAALTFNYVQAWNNEKQKWDVQWGQVEKSKPLTLSTSQSLDTSAFEGVDEAGKVVEVKATAA